MKASLSLIACVLFVGCGKSGVNEGHSSVSVGDTVSEVKSKLLSWGGIPIHQAIYRVDTETKPTLGPYEYQSEIPEPNAFRFKSGVVLSLVHSDGMVTSLETYRAGVFKRDETSPMRVDSVSFDDLR